MSRARLQKVSALWEMARPSQLALIVLVYGLGVAMAAARGVAVAPAAVLAAGLALLPTAASVHHVNEYVDHETDALTDPTPFSGGSGALPRTGLPPRFALRAALGSLAVGTVATVAGVAVGLLSGVAVAILVVITVLGWAYSVGPALAWRGLGEVTNALLGGICLPLYGFVVVGGRVDAPAVLAVVPFAVYVFTNLLATQWPDREADATVGKRTLPTRWSPARLRRAHLASATLSLGLLAVLPLLELLPPAVGWSSLLVLPGAVVAARRFTVVRSPFPTVAVMVTMAAIQFLAWTALAVL
ncbi:prenyltransferase [Haloarchaeobius amylolyticus]|uniref:prenyltransferase n=1 Tax=Haloarchaeobius amylolyticus TaxID=1198296 RepID=UPI00226F559C|nr:prenyltransferase [Haloarchaeobius amylolyticus]